MGYASLSTSFSSTSGYFQYLILGWSTLLLSSSHYNGLMSSSLPYSNHGWQQVPGQTGGGGSRGRENCPQGAENGPGTERAGAANTTLE